MVPRMRVHIPGKPIPYPRSAGSGSRRYTPGPFRDWIELAARAIAETEGIDLGIEVPVSVLIAVTPRGCDVDLKPSTVVRPKGLRGDIDNYAKAVLDALQWRDEHPLAPPGWILDDRQVVVESARFAG